jgi:hypothetical protein
VVHHLQGQFQAADRHQSHFTRVGSERRTDHLGGVLFKDLDEHRHSPKCLVPHNSTPSQIQTVMTALSDTYFSLSTNAPATNPTTLLASSSTSNKCAHAMHAMRAATRAGGKLSFNALAHAAPRTFRRVFGPSVGPRRPIRIIELVRMGGSESD